MSHVISIAVEIQEKYLKQLAEAAIELGGKLIKQETYTWYGRHVGDYPLPPDFTVDMLGKCEYAIKFEGISYEVGIARNKAGKLVVIYDFWDSRLGEKMGKNAAELIKLYNKAIITAQAKKLGKRVVSKQVGKEIHLEIT